MRMAKVRASSRLRQKIQSLTTTFTKRFPKNRKTMKIIAVNLMTSQMGICDIVNMEREKQRLKLVILCFSVQTERSI